MPCKQSWVEWSHQASSIRRSWSSPKVIVWPPFFRSCFIITDRPLPSTTSLFKRSCGTDPTTTGSTSPETLTFDKSSCLQLSSHITTVYDLHFPVFHSSAFNSEQLFYTIEDGFFPTFSYIHDGALVSGAFSMEGGIVTKSSGSRMGLLPGVRSSGHEGTTNRFLSFQDLLLNKTTTPTYGNFYSRAP